MNSCPRSCPHFQLIKTKSNHAILGLCRGQQIHFHGFVNICLVRGKASVNGYQLQRNQYIRIASPEWSSALSIRSLGTTKDSIYTEDFSQIYEAISDRKEIKETENLYDIELDRRFINDPSSISNREITCSSDNDELDANYIAMKLAMSVVIKIRLEESRTLNFNSQHHDPIEPSSFRFYRAEDMISEELKNDKEIQNMISHMKFSPLIVPQLLQSAVDEMMQIKNKNLISLVCGGKGSGKSTSCRYITNRLISEGYVVAFLDTDIGQSELTCPGVVSLHLLKTPLLEPSSMHLRIPFRAYFIGDISPKTQPLTYINAIKQLVELYQEKWGSNTQVHLVVNTSGWIKGMGQDLLSSIMEIVHPSFVVQLLGSTPSQQFSITPPDDCKLHLIPAWAISANHPRPSPNSEEARQLLFRSYFLQETVFPTTVRHTIDYAKKLTMQPVYKIPFTALSIRIMSSSVPPSQSLYALNGSIVGLCIDLYRDSTKQKLQFLTSTQLNHCVGLGIIRNIDMKSLIFYITTPLEFSILQHVNLLVKGSLHLPVELSHQKSIFPEPYCVVDAISAEGSATMKSRNNLKRRKQNL